MKVICINNRFYKDEITIGKTYEIIEAPQQVDISEDIRCFYFIADDGSKILYFESDTDFIPLEQHRENQLNKIDI